MDSADIESPEDNPIAERKKDRFDLKGCKTTMKAVVTNGNGGYEQLEYRDVPIPALAAGDRMATQRRDPEATQSRGRGLRVAGPP